MNTDALEVNAVSSTKLVKPSERVTNEHRVSAIDTLRGLVIILMALDHVREFFSNASFPPEDLSRTTPALFLTRWITHFCAPAFVLLAGISACLWATSRRKQKPELARFLITRGLWLIFLELTLVRLAWFFSFDYETTMAQVIWAIGWSMIVLAGLIFLPNWLIFSFAIVMIVGHNTLDRITVKDNGFLANIWTVLHHPGGFEVLPGHILLIVYPLIPWIGVMALGYAVGSMFLNHSREHHKWLFLIGCSAILEFLLLRSSNIYGDPTPWYVQKDTLTTVLSFFNVEKYPPSLLYLLITLGPIFCGLAVLDRPAGALEKLVSVFGRVPLFFYVTHLFLIHGVAILLSFLKYGRADWLFGTAWLFRGQYPPDYGYSLPGVYLLWACVVVALYPLCKWFADYKQNHKNWWLSYL